MLNISDPVMTDLLNRATKTFKRHYLTHQIQNELIEYLATSVIEYITTAVAKSKKLRNNG